MNFQHCASSIDNQSAAPRLAGRSGFWFGALALCLGFLFTSQAYAACGYYVTAGNPGQNSMSASDSMNHAFSGASGQHHSSNMPRCHAGDSNPGTTAVLPASSDEQSVGLCNAQTPPQIVFSSTLKSHNSAHQPEVYLPLFDPPPRSPSL